MHTVGLCDVVDELHDKYSLADTRATEKANFPASLVRRQ